MEVIDVTMAAIETIFCMLDWNNPIETQDLGRLLAKDLTNLDLFCQPFCEKYNKNVWENCAIILSEKRDAELQPYLTKMLEWLQDLNWPGALCILERLQKYSDKKSLKYALSICLQNAKNNHDITWIKNLKLVNP